MISYSFFAGSVSDPPFATDAAHLLRNPTSRSVASSFTSLPVGLDEHVREDRNRVLALDDALEELQFSQQVCLPDDKLHVLVTSRDALGWRADLFELQ